MNKIKELKRIIDESNNIVLFTGAGISVPSGIPDFRSSNGLYSNLYDKTFSPEEIISHSFYKKHPDIFYKFYKEKMIYPDALPNKAHYYFTKLEELGKLKAIVTQNIDGLHQASGSINVIELHGTINSYHCEKCFKHYERKDIYHSLVPKCNCGGTIKPDVVLYEEELNYHDIERAIDYISHAETLIIVGTSLVVYPASSFVRYFKGKNLVVINKDHTYLDSYALTLNMDIIDCIKGLEEDS